jgi:hypothetical protein
MYLCVLQSFMILTYLRGKIYVCNFLCVKMAKSWQTKFTSKQRNLKKSNRVYVIELHKGFWMINVHFVNLLSTHRSNLVHTNEYLLLIISVKMRYTWSRSHWQMSSPPLVHCTAETYRNVCVCVNVYMLCECLYVSVFVCVCLCVLNWWNNLSWWKPNWVLVRTISNEFSVLLFFSNNNSCAFIETIV